MTVATAPNANDVKVAETVLSYGPAVRRLTDRDGDQQANVRVSIKSFPTRREAFVLVETIPLGDPDFLTDTPGSEMVSLDYDQSSIIQVIQVWQIFEFLVKALKADEEMFALGTLSAAEQAAGAWLCPKDSTSFNPLIEIIGIRAVSEVVNRTIDRKTANDLFCPKTRVDPTDYYKDAEKLVELFFGMNPFLHTVLVVRVLDHVSVALSGGLNRLSKGTVLGTAAARFLRDRRETKKLSKWISENNFLGDWSPYFRAPKPTEFELATMIWNFAQFDFPAESD